MVMKKIITIFMIVLLVNILPVAGEFLQTEQTFETTDLPSYFNFYRKLSKSSYPVHFKRSKKCLMTGDGLVFITGDNVYIIDLKKSAHISPNILNKYYSVVPTSTTLERPEVKPSMPSFVKDRIQQLERLPSAWDSYSARPIDARAIAATKSLLIQISDLAPELVSSVFIAPCSDGGIQLEWELNSKELIIKITPDGHQCLFLLVSSSR